MKIDNSAKTIGSVQSPGASRTSGRQATAGAKGVPASPTPAAPGVSADLSVDGLEAAFNSQKVAEIRQAISDGRFQINPERIADGLITSVREMLAQQGGRPAGR